MDPVVLIPLVVILFFAALGYRAGVIKRLVEVAGLVLTVVLTARFAADLTPRVVAKTGWSEGASLLLAWALLILAGLVLSRLLGVLVSKAVRLTILGWVDRLGGAVCGAMIGTVVASVLLVLASMAPGGNTLRAAFEEDPVGAFIYGTAPNLAAQAKVLAGDRFAEIWDRVSDEAREQADRAGEHISDAARDGLDDARRRGEAAAGR